MWVLVPTRASVLSTEPGTGQVFRTHMNEGKEVNRLSGLLAVGSSYLPHHPCYPERYSFQATESKERCQTGETGPGEGSGDKDEGVKSFQSKVRLGSCSCPQAPFLVSFILRYR